MDGPIRNLFMHQSLAHTRKVHQYGVPYLPLVVHKYQKNSSCLCMEYLYAPEYPLEQVQSWLRREWVSSLHLYLIPRPSVSICSAHRLAANNWPFTADLDLPAAFFCHKPYSKVTPTYMELFPHLTSTKNHFFTISVHYREFLIQHKKLLMSTSEKIFKLRRTDVSVSQSF